jgi:hypothetical protein
MAFGVNARQAGTPPSLAARVVAQEKPAGMLALPGRLQILSANVSLMCIFTYCDTKK